MIITGLLISSWPSTLAQTKLRKWERSIKAYEKGDKQKMPELGGILFIGSSSIRGWKTMKQDFPSHNVINRGFGGSEITDSIHFADRIIYPYKPKQILLYAGDNDMARGKSAQTVFSDFKNFVSTVHKKLPKARISFIAIKPSLRRWKLSEKMSKANGIIESYCGTDDRLEFINIWKPMLGRDGKPKAELFVKDGLHLNSKGYALWKKTVIPYLIRE